MKYLKSYKKSTEDDLSNSPQPGDYVICEEEDIAEELENFINNNIGQFIEYSKRQNQINYHLIQYNNIPNNILRFFKHSSTLPNCRFMVLEEIKHWSPNKEKLEPIILAKKFNI